MSEAGRSVCRRWAPSTTTSRRLTYPSTRKLAKNLGVRPSAQASRSRCHQTTGGSPLKPSTDPPSSRPVHVSGKRGSACNALGHSAGQHAAVRRRAARGGQRHPRPRLHQATQKTSSMGQVPPDVSASPGRLGRYAVAGLLHGTSVAVHHHCSNDGPSPRVPADEHGAPDRIINSTVPAARHTMRTRSLAMASPA